MRTEGAGAPATDALPPAGAALPSAVRFEALAEPGAEVARTAAAAAPHNPLLTPAYAAALAALGPRPMLLVAWDGPRVAAACYARLRAGRLRRTLEVESWPGDAGPAFAAEFARLCDTLQADVVEVGTFCSPPGALPELPGRVRRRDRCEHAWELRDADLARGLSSNHRRNVTRARKAGVVADEATNEAALADHVRLTGASLARRSDRGERVTAALDPLDQWRAYVSTGAARIFQARAEGRVVSSILLLAAAEGAYYQSAGTEPAGMELGASQFLVFEVAARLAAEGAAVFNLGGAEPSNAGLYRFKSGFGTRPVELESRRYEFERSWRARAASAVRKLAPSTKPA